MTEALLRGMLVVMIIVAFAFYAIGGAVMVWAIVDTTGWYLPAAYVGWLTSWTLAYSETEAELTRSLPIARIR